MDSLPAGKLYSSLKQSYVIFICLEDIFGKGRYCYVFENVCLDCDNLRLNDGTYKLFFNTKGTRGKVSQEVKNFLAYLEDRTMSDDSFIKRLDDEVTRIKNNNRWRVSYMTQYMRDLEKIREGKIEGATEKAIEIAKRLIDRGISIEATSEIAEISIEDIKAVL